MIDTALYLIPVELGDTPQNYVLPDKNKEIVCEIRHFIVEDIRSARRFLRRMNKQFDIDSTVFYTLNKHTSAQEMSSYLDALKKGIPMGVISEAGCPAVADPGADVVAVAQQNGLKVVPLVGPSSIILSVMASGFNGQSFAFNGYLPIDSAERARRLKALESRCYGEDQTQLFIETPYRNHKMIDFLLATLKPTTRMCIAAGITTADEWIKSMRISEWRKQKSIPDLSKIPSIFLIYKG